VVQRNINLTCSFSKFQSPIHKTKKSKLKLYWSIIRPIVTYACEIWVLKETIKNKLTVFEKKMLRRIFGPTKERDDTWRIKTNDELDELIIHKNIINHTKAKRLSWFGHLHRVSEERMVKRVYRWKPMLTRPLGRPKNRWEDDKINDIKNLKIKTVVDLQLDAQSSYLFTYNTFIKILYMFRVLPCSYSGGLRHNCIYAASGIVTL
jgi:hypothetical protein